MGSSGSGRFTDYPGSAGSNASGPNGRDDRCGKAFSAQLEDVEHCPYYAAHGTPPKVGTALEIGLAKRIVAIADGKIVGNLPTRLNYLASCMKGGYVYVGKVTTSKSGPSIIVSADFAATSA